MIKRFKNGNIHLDARKEIKEGLYTAKDWRIHTEGSMFYRNQMITKNIYLWTYENTLYVVDCESKLFYKTFSNEPKEFLSNIIKKQRIILKPASNKINKNLEIAFSKEL